MQLLIKVGTSGDDPHYQDGDIVEAFSDSRILRMYAEQLCTGSLREKYIEATSKYKFQRVGSSVERHNLITGQTDVLSSTPNDQGEYIDVQRYVDRRRVLFGNTGSERWYGGSSAITSSELWDIIEVSSDYVRSDYQQWPLSVSEKRHFLPISCNGTGELSHGTACSRLESIYSDEDNQVILQKRRWRVPYWDLASSLGINIDDVRDQNIELDLRHESISDSPMLDETNEDKLI